MATVSPQSFAHSSRADIVVHRHTRCAQSHTLNLPLHLAAIVAVVNKLWTQKFINHFNYRLQNIATKNNNYVTVTSSSSQLGFYFFFIKIKWIKKTELNGSKDAFVPKADI